MRRSAVSGTKRCTDPYVYDIEQMTSVKCDGSVTPCVWKGRFKVKMYNADPSKVSFDWATDKGTTPSGHDKEEVEVWVTASANTVFNLTCTITVGADTATLTKEFESENVL